MYFTRVKELHNIALEARILLEKPDTEPRTDIRISPNGKAYVSLYTTCFSFTSPDFRVYTFEINKIDEVIEKARVELKHLREVEAYTHATPTAFREKPHTIPLLVCLKDTQRIYYLHLCPNHRKTKIRKRMPCTCYVTWEDIGKKDK